MTPATAMARKKRSSFADAAPPRDADLLRHEIASALLAAGGPLHQTLIQARLRVRVPLWEILQALHLGGQHFVRTGIGTWDLRDEGRVLGAQPLPPTDEPLQDQSGRSSRSRTKATGEGRRAASSGKKALASDGEAAEKPARAASSRKKTVSDGEAAEKPARAASSRRKTVSDGEAAETPARAALSKKKADAAEKPVRAVAAAKTAAAGDEEPPWNTSTSEPGPARAVAKPKASRPPAATSRLEVPWDVLPSVTEALRACGHPRPAHALKGDILASGGVAEFEGLLALAEASPELTRYPFGRGLYLGLAEWGSQAWEEVAESLWQQARVQLLASDLVDLQAVRALQAVAQRKGDAQVAEVAQRLLGA